VRRLFTTLNHDPNAVHPFFRLKVVSVRRISTAFRRFVLVRLTPRFDLHGRLADAMAFFSNAPAARVLVAFMALAFWFASYIEARPARTNPRSNREAIIELENEWLSHISDAPTLERILADDFVHPVPAGVFLTKQQHIRWAVAHPHAASWRSTFERLDVRVYDKTAVATGIVSATEHPGDKPQRTIFTDVFVFRDGRWKAVNAQENEISNGSWAAKTPRKTGDSCES
jgi:hypothetical protein